MLAANAAAKIAMQAEGTFERKVLFPYNNNIIRPVCCTSRLRWQRQRRQIWPRRSLHRYNSKANTKVYQCLNTFRLVHTYTLEHTGRNSRGGSSEQERSADRRGNGRAEAAQSVCRDQSFHQCCFFFTWPLTPGARLHGSPVNSVSVSYGTPPTSSGLDQHL